MCNFPLIFGSAIYQIKSPSFLYQFIVLVWYFDVSLKISPGAHQRSAHWSLHAGKVHTAEAHTGEAHTREVHTAEVPTGEVKRPPYLYSLTYFFLEDTFY